jgi:hypothetical protein
MLVTGLSAFVDPTANRMAVLLGARLPDVALLPEWDTLTEVRWTDGDGYLATHSASITYSTWDTLQDEIRRGSPDGIRVRRQGNVVTVAAAAKAASFLHRRGDGSVAGAFAHRPGGLLRHATGRNRGRQARPP